MKIKHNSKILVIGDSITWAARNLQDPNDLGKGYCYFLQQALTKQATIINRGISGDRSLDILNRYEKDVLSIKPDYIIVLIGINDVWHQYMLGKTMTNLEFENNLTKFFDAIKNDLNVPVMIIEPFIIDTDPDKNIFYQELYQKFIVLRRLARKYHHEYLTLDGKFAEKSVEQPPFYWSEDGIHPTLAGHELIANCILNRLEIE